MTVRDFYQVARLAPAAQPKRDAMVDTVRILVVDDNEQDRLLIVRAVGRELPAAVFESVQDAAAFSRALEEGCFDLVITDYGLSWGNGLAILQRVKERSRDCPVILFTASGTEEVAVAAMQAGVEDYLLKTAPQSARLPLAVRAALTRAAARREAERAGQALRFLAEAGEILASSLDYEATLASVARLVVPRLADWCSVYIPSPDGQPRQLAVAHVDPAKVAWAQSLASRYPPDPDAPRGVPQVLRSGQPDLISEITEAMIVAGARDAEHLEIIRGLGLKSLMTVPLNARGRTLGAITFVAAESGRRYGPDDLGFAQELARRAAYAVDNARLYGEAREALRLREEAARQLGLLVEASGSLTRSLGLADVLAAVLDLSHHLIAADAYAIWRLRPEADCWEVARASGLSEAYLREAGRILGASQHMPDEPMAVEDAEAVAVLEDRRAAYRAEGIVSLLVAPLRVHGSVSGTLVFYYRSRRRFEPITVRLAMALANLSGAAIGTAELYERESASRCRAEDADRRKDEWVTMLAHELRNPLVPILTGLHVVRHAGVEAGAKEQALAMMERQVRHMSRLVDDLLDVSRIVRGKVQLRRERLDLGRLVRTAAEDRRRTLERAGLTLTVEVPETPVWVSGDATRIAQVLNNLLDNATKFTDRGGQVAVHLTAENAGWQAALGVRDTGVGIEAGLLPRVFDAFAQADRSLERASGGLGLGLALVKSLVELHGGQVQAASAGPGRGAEFTVRLPLEQEPAALAEPAGATQVATKGRRVLVIEDNHDAADSLRLLLEVLGHEVQVASSGYTGVTAAKEWGPDVVISDIGLPGLNGYGVAEALRRDPATARTLLIGLSGYGRDEDIRRAHKAGYDHYLVKPASPEQLEGLLALPGVPAE